MSTAIQSALAGLRTAGLGLERSAANIARGNAAAYNALNAAGDPALPGTPAATLGQPSGPSANALAAQEFSLSENVVSFKEAELLYKTNAKVLGALHRLEGELIDTIG